jgi:opine dehydrogenase
MVHEIKRVLVMGAGNGGKTSAADLGIQGKIVRLWEFPEWSSSLKEVQASGQLVATGDFEGTAKIELATSNLAEAIKDCDTIFVCTVAQAHERVAKEMAPFMKPEHVVVLNPGSTGGTLVLARVWQELGMTKLPTLVEFHTLLYGTRASGDKVTCSLKVKYLNYGTLPAAAITEVGPSLETLFPALHRSNNVLAAGLCNANPIIHPPIVLCNLAQIEKNGTAMRFYADGVSPMVANLIEGLDKERMALLTALGGEAIPDPKYNKLQGYCDDDSSYYACFGLGPVFGTFASPPGENLAKHRYFTEDAREGLGLYCSLGKVLGVPTPTAAAVIQLSSIACQEPDFVTKPTRTVATLGLDGMNKEQILAYLGTGLRK